MGGQGPDSTAYGYGPPPPPGAYPPGAYPPALSAARRAYYGPYPYAPYPYPYYYGPGVTFRLRVRWLSRLAWPLALSRARTI